MFKHIYSSAEIVHHFDGDFGDWWPTFYLFYFSFSFFRFPIIVIDLIYGKECVAIMCSERLRDFQKQRRCCVLLKRSEKQNKNQTK